MTSTVSVVTINILGGSTRWTDRLSLLITELNALRPDLIAIQEVADPCGRGSAYQLAEALGEYQVAVAAKRWTFGRPEGIAILSRWPILWHEIIPLEGEGRVAQFVRVKVRQRYLVLGNCHCLWLPFDRWRTRQVAHFLKHLQSRPDDLLVACGDFNARPESQAIALATRTLTSAHAAIHGQEPKYTCPTPLRSGNAIRDALFDTVYCLAGNRRDGPWRATLDYIFVGPGIRVLDCSICLNLPATTDAGLYPSDHFGLVARLELTTNDQREQADSSFPPLMSPG